MLRVSTIFCTFRVIKPTLKNRSYVAGAGIAPLEFRDKDRV